MKRCEVMIPFHMKATDTDHVPGDVIEVSDAQLANIKAINVNMVLVLGEVEAKPKRSRKKVEGKGE